MALLCLVVLCALGQAWGSVGAVDGVFSKSDRKDLANLMKDQQQKDGSWGSLENTYEAVSALLALKYSFARPNSCPSCCPPCRRTRD